MQELIEKCQQGDMGAWGELYEACHVQVYRTALAITRDEKLAEDILQDTFVQVYRKIGLFKRNQSFEGWLYKIVLNLCRNAWRKQKYRRMVEFVQRFGQTSSHGTSPEDLYVAKESEHALIELLRRLTYHQQTVLVLKYFNDFSQEQIAEILDIPVGTVKSRLHSALARLKEIEQFQSAKSGKERVTNESNESNGRTNETGFRAMDRA